MNDPIKLDVTDIVDNTELEAAAFRRLISHLQSHTDIQNIDLMNTGGFCRNCLARWLAEEAQKQGYELPDDTARQYIYGMPYADWKARFQKP